MDIDLFDGRLYGGDPHPAYEFMRANGGVHFDAKNKIWGAATYDAVLDASKHPDQFSNAGGSRPDMALPMMIDMDDPAHWKRRKLVNRGFTPKRVRDSELELRQVCDDLIDRVCEQGECDFVRDLAAPLPMIVIGDMLGVAPEDRDDLLRWSDEMVSAQGGNITEATMTAAANAMSAYTDFATKAIAARRAEPTDDLFSVLAHAEVDGDRLDDEEILYEALLILVGGDETTRHVISGGMHQLMLNPDQRQRLIDEPAGISGAVEETLRWVSPIKNMNRTIVADMEFHGAQLKRGQKMLLLYEAANYDDKHFADPHTFDAAREPNDHLAFGFGAHYCLGQALARVELNVMFERLLARLPDMELATDDPLPRRQAMFISGFESMPVRFTAKDRLRAK